MERASCDQLRWKPLWCWRVDGDGRKLWSAKYVRHCVHLGVARDLIALYNGLALGCNPFKVCLNELNACTSMVQGMITRALSVRKSR